MVGKTHLAAGVAVGAAVCLQTNLAVAPGMICLAGAALGALLPDIDHRNSTISKKVKPVGTIVSAVAGHRTIFHDPVLYLLLGVLCIVMKPAWIVYVATVLLGVTSHLVLDALNPTGIPIMSLLHDTKIHLASIYTGGKIDRIIGLGFTVVGRLAAIVWFVKAIFSLLPDFFSLCLFGRGFFFIIGGTWSVADNYPATSVLPYQHRSRNQSKYSGRMCIKESYKNTKVCSSAAE